MKKATKILKTLSLSALSGIILAGTVGLYKFCAHHIIHFSDKGFILLREKLWLAPFVLALLFLFSLALERVYRRYKNLKGGGIPNAVLAARGKKSLFPVTDALGIFLLSLFSFLLGVPLGNEGPCVQMGAAISGGISKLFSKDEEIKNTQTAAGACAGFAAATGAPLAGISFCFDEITRRPKLSLIMSAAASSVVCAAVLHFVCPFLGVEAALFGRIEMPAFSIKYIWVAAAVGVIFGIFSIVFLKAYKLLRAFYNKTLCKVQTQYKIFFVLALTFVAGLVSTDFISTGHGLSVELISAAKPLIYLVMILLVRSFLTFSANSNGLSGGTFVPIIAVGAVLGALVADALGAQCYQLILMLSITATIAAMMKMPLVSVMFALEIFRCPQYILYIIIAAAISYIMAQCLKAKSLSEIVLEENE